jgi:predicted enzyme related to lactoylglutathione lyase
MKRDHINWFEIPVTDMKRAKKFYETIFDFTMQDLDIGDETKMSLFPQAGGIYGALCQNKDFYTPSHEGTLIYLNGDPDLAVVLNRVETAGGHIIIPKRIITEQFGYMAVFEDSEGNRIALHSMK